MTRGAVMCVAESTDRPGPPRVGVSVTRKQGGAVVRNRAKRRLREAARRHLAAISPGTDLVLVARGDCARRSWQELEEDVVAAMAGATTR